MTFCTNAGPLSVVVLSFIGTAETVLDDIQNSFVSLVYQGLCFGIVCNYCDFLLATAVCLIGSLCVQFFVLELFSCEGKKSCGLQHCCVKIL